MLGAAVLLGIWPLSMSAPRQGIVLWPIAALLAVLAYLRVAGRTVDEWLVAAISYGGLRLSDRHKYLGAAFTPRSKKRGVKPRLDLPGILAPLTIREVVDGNLEPMAIAQHELDGTFTAVARIRYPGIALVDQSRRDQRVAGWGALLSGLCTEGNPIVRVQALQRLVPESGAALRRWHDDHLSDSAPEAAAEITKTLLQNSTLATSEREAFLAFTLDKRRAASAIKAAGGGAAGASVVLVRQIHALSSAITGADLQIESWLSPRDLAEVLRTAFDPHSSRVLAEQRANAATTRAMGAEGTNVPGVPPTMAGPAAAEAHRGHYQHDGAYSVSYWIGQWPEHEIFSTALAPLLGEGIHHRRSISIHIEPLSPRKAESEVMRERTARHVAVSMRKKSGQIVPEHEQMALEQARAQDRERAAGHGLVRFSAYATVTVTDLADLENACAALESSAAQARIEIRRMWMAQDVGFALAALPLGMGLPKKRY
nr:SCO6880 family protein [Actinomadura hibisca]